MRPQEGPFSGAVAYAIGVLLVIWLFPPDAAFVGWLALAVGDSAAEIAGRFAPIRRWRWCQKSVGGTLGFIIGSTFAILAGLLWWNGETGWNQALPVFVVSLPSAAAEAVCVGACDNLIVPLVAAASYAVIRKVW